MHDYYRARAREYEAIYHRDDPVRQGEQAEIAEAMKEVLRDRRVLEVACGTGFWTEVVAGVARHVVAIDAAPEMLEIARGKGLAPDKVEFRLGDAYALDSVPGAFDAGLANFWFSHIPKARIAEFLSGFHKRIGEGAAVFMADNVYVPGIGGELFSRPGSEDTFKRRTLSDSSQHRLRRRQRASRRLRTISAVFLRIGRPARSALRPAGLAGLCAKTFSSAARGSSEQEKGPVHYEILKNYYDADQLRRILSPHARDLIIHVGKRFWWVNYRTAQIRRIRPGSLI